MVDLCIKISKSTIIISIVSRTPTNPVVHCFSFRLWKWINHHWYYTFLKGIFQVGSLSVLLFVLTVNPLSFVLHNLKGYQYGNKKNSNVTHNFFVDDLKLYANNINTSKKLLDLITIFFKDTAMTFGEDKCGYHEKGELINNTKELQINNLKIKLIPEGDSYKYLGRHWWIY